MVIAAQGRVISQQARTIRVELSKEFGFRNHLPIELIQEALDELDIEWQRLCVHPNRDVVDLPDPGAQR